MEINMAETIFDKKKKKDQYALEYEQTVKPNIFNKEAKYEEFKPKSFEESYGEKEKKIEGDRNTASVIDGLANIAAAIVSYKTGLNVGKIEGNKIDWEKKIDRLRQDYDRELDLAYKQHLLNNDQVEKLKAYQENKLQYATGQANQDEQTDISIKEKAADMAWKEKEAAGKASMHASSLANNLAVTEMNNEGALKRATVATEADLEQEAMSNASKEAIAKAKHEAEMEKTITGINGKIKINNDNIRQKNVELTELNRRVAEANQLKQTLSDEQLASKEALAKQELDQAMQIHDDKIAQIRASRSLDEFQIKEDIRLAEIEMANNTKDLKDKLAVAREAIAMKAGKVGVLGQKKQQITTEMNDYQKENTRLNDKRILQKQDLFEKGEGLKILVNLKKGFGADSVDPNKLYELGNGAIYEVGMALGLSDEEMQPYLDRYAKSEITGSSWGNSDREDKAIIYKQTMDIINKMKDGQPDVKEPVVNPKPTKSASVEEKTIAGKVYYRNSTGGWSPK